MVKNVHADLYAKTLVSGEYGVSVFTHCLIVGIIAREYLKYLPKKLVKKYSLDSFPLFAADHDLGKASPGFQDMLKHYMGESGYDLIPVIQGSFFISTNQTHGTHLIPVLQGSFLHPAPLPL